MTKHETFLWLSFPLGWSGSSCFFKQNKKKNMLRTCNIYLIGSTGYIVKSHSGWRENITNNNKEKRDCRAHMHMFTVHVPGVFGWAIPFSCHGGRSSSSRDPRVLLTVLKSTLFVRRAFSVYWPAHARTVTSTSPVLSPTLPVNCKFTAITNNNLSW